jgi:hypothetical protein
MKKLLTLAAALVLFAATQAFAIIGVGAHYVMNTGSLKGSSGKVYDFPADHLLFGGDSINFRQEKTSGLQGLGFKIWLDFIPFVDIEGTLNIAATRYNTFLIVPPLDPNKPDERYEKKLSYTPDAPYSMMFGDASPLFGIVNGDLSVTYPFDLPVIRPYVGIGISYFASIPIINDNFAREMLSGEDGKKLVDALTGDPDAASAVGDALIKALEKESYTSGIGGHLIAGFRIKAPIIPVAVYTNGKYYFGGNTNSQFTQGFVLEVGGGFAL